ncbi:hypothetical protein JK192_13685 [Gluconobacter cerinus]|uniref:hypothetical protein n=1 Tax=Gluconobacter cerinus TaxID=38307 RepID=UPI001B8C1239|nr:hypothetical protein [Gluconobacter cerinus]MBS1032429.1 hypothetical protein [Gluconobacter cerinus]
MKFMHITMPKGTLSTRHHGSANFLCDDLVNVLNTARIEAHKVKTFNDGDWVVVSGDLLIAEVYISLNFYPFPDGVYIRKSNC